MAVVKLLVAMLALCSTNQMSAFAVTHVGTECPQPMVKQDFNATKYQGMWFQYEAFPRLEQMGTKCVIANYTTLGGNQVKVVNTAIQEYSYGIGLCPWYQSTTALGSAEILDDKEPAKLGVKFNPNQPTPSPYWVLDTDYVSYAVVYSCSKVMDVMPLYSETAWVLTRQRGVAPPQLDDIHQRLVNEGIDPSYFEITDQKGCPEWKAK